MKLRIMNLKVLLDSVGINKREKRIEIYLVLEQGRDMHTWGHSFMAKS